MDKIIELLSSQKTLRMIEVGGRSALGFAAAAYFIGIIVVNLHLAKYGFHSLVYWPQFQVSSFWV